MFGFRPSIYLNGLKGLDYNFNRGNYCQRNLLHIIDLIQMTCKITTSTMKYFRLHLALRNIMAFCILIFVGIEGLTCSLCLRVSL